MPEPTLLSDVIQPAWNALTAEERTCWHFWAAAHPQLTTNGRLQILFGQQRHYQLNANIAVLESEPLLSTPPPADTPPEVPKVTGQAWPITAQLGGTTTSRGGFAYVYFDTPPASNVGVIIGQGYTRQKNKPWRVTGNRHVTVAPPGTTGEVSLTTPTGYFASTAGATKYAVIKGKTARRRPDLPLARMKVINLENGIVVSATINNPNGGAPVRIRRPRHVDP